MKKGIDRRSFLKITGTGFVINRLERLRAKSPADLRHPEIALITNLIDRQLDENWKETLKKVAEIGYRNIEFNKIGNAGKDELKSFLSEISLRPLAGGGAMSEFSDPLKFKTLIADTLFYGKPYLVCYWPWMDDGANKKSEDFFKLSEQLNLIGERCNRQGIRFALHNHMIEFNQYQEQTGYDILMHHTDPSKVTMLLDVYWATKAGADVTQLLENYKGRIELLHVKDMDRTPERKYTCPGYGIIDFSKILKVAAKSGVKYYIVEVDAAPADPMTCVADSYKYVKSIM